MIDQHKESNRCKNLSGLVHFPNLFSLLFATAVILVTQKALARGTWAPLAHPPPAGLNNSLLLSDGTVICGDGGSGWYRLTPDNHGSYVNGTWSVLAASHYTRLFYSSDILTNGNLYVAGGEYGTGGAHAEVYDTLNNTWKDVPQPASNPGYSDAVSKILPNGNVLQGTTGGNVWIYNPSLNNITAAASARNQNEACWVKLTNDCVLTIDAFGMQSEHYVPSLNIWVNDGNVPVSLYGYGGELGAGFVLPNGTVFYIGGSTHTAIYTPGATVTSAGSWVAGPDMIFGGNGLGAVDAPATMLVNGKILMAIGPTNGFNSPTSYYEYDYTINGYAQVNGPTGLTYNAPPFVTTFLDLPDGNALYIGGQGSTSVYVYFPDGTPLAAGQPVINSITENSDGSYHLVGTGLNGISSGAAYGDDWQMDSNYPLVRLTNSVTGNVYYARTYGWNSTSVMTGNRIVTTEFALPPALPAGTYSLVVAANGNPSAPQFFAYSPSAAPTGLSATIGNTQLGLSWNPVPGATVYNLKRSVINGSYFVNIATTLGTNFTDTGLVNGTTYYYVVTAVTSGGPSPYSSQLAAAPFGPPPPPSSLVVGPDSYVGLALSWNLAPNATSYNVKRSATSGGPYTNVVTRYTPDYNDTDVVVGVTYFYVVSALSAGGESSNSAQASGVPSASGDALNGIAANWQLDDAAGSSAVDSSGHSNTGTLVNAPSWVIPGRVGTSDLSFAAASLQSVTAVNSVTLNMTSGITISAWVNPIDWSGGNRRVLQKGNSDNQYRFLCENNVLKFHLNGVATLTCPLPATNAWTHLAATWNGSTMAIYANGILQASQAATGAITTTADPLAIGKKNGSTSAGDYFNGQLDEVRVYNRGLTATEVATIVHVGDLPPLAPTGVAAAAGNNQITVSWSTVTNASSYNVKRSSTSGGPYTVVGTSLSTFYTDAGLTNGTPYYYVVSSVNFTNESLNSSQVVSTPTVGVSFFADVNYGGAAGRALGVGNYTLSQLQSAGIANDSASSCKIPNGWTVTIYQNDNFQGASWILTTNTLNFGVYSGLNDNMSSCKIVSGAVPPTPAGLNATAGDAQVALNWGPAATATAYNLRRSTNSGGPYASLLTTTALSYLDTAVVNNTTYFYVVSSVNSVGESALSSEVTATPYAQPIVLTVLPLTNSVFSFQFNGVDGRNYTVQMSTNLVDWSSIATNQTSGGVSVYNETNIFDPARFYRVQQ
jgi:fibronectin type 3 domain-containing protein